MSTSTETPENTPPVVPPTEPVVTPVDGTTPPAVGPVDSQDPPDPVAEPVQEDQPQLPVETKPAREIDVSAKSKKPPVVTPPTPPVQPPVPPTPPAPKPLSVFLTNVKATLDQYIAGMGVNVITNVEKGKLQQRGLFNVYLRILESDEVEAGMDLVLGVIAANRHGAFEDGRAFRYIQQMPVVPDEQKLFQALQGLYTRTANPQSRALVLRSIDLVKIKNQLPSPQMQKALMSYFTPILE